MRGRVLDLLAAAASQAVSLASLNSMAEAGSNTRRTRGSQVTTQRTKMQIILLWTLIEGDARVTRKVELNSDDRCFRRRRQTGRDSIPFKVLG